MNYPHSNPKNTALRVLVIGGLIGVSVVLAACGQKGPLVMPADTVHVAPSSSASPSAPESK